MDPTLTLRRGGVPAATDDRLGLIIGGVQKSGTTTLHRLLAETPGFAAPQGLKELHFFDDETQDWSAPDIAGYHAHFPLPFPGDCRFETTPIYLFWPPALARIRAYHPGIRLVFLVRDPVERAFSQWCMEWARGAETLDFAAAIAAEPARLAAAPPLGGERRAWSYAERGLYGAQAARLLTLFPRGQILFERFEALRDEPGQVLARIAALLGRPAPPALAAPLHENRRAPARYPSAAPDAATRAALLARFGPDLRRFAALTGLDIRDWPSWRATDPA